MVDPLVFIDNIFSEMAWGGSFFYLSLALFCFEFLLGVCYLLWLSCFVNLKKKTVK